MGKKTFALFLVILIIGMVHSLSGLAESEVGVPVSMKAGELQPMPESSAQDYHFKEKAILQDLLVQSHTLDTYYAAFSTTRITQADIDQRYEQYDKDMSAFLRQVSQTRMKIAELNPATEPSKEYQKNTLEKIDLLYSIVSEYGGHEVSANDTAAYLGECRQALVRLAPQGKLEF